MTYDNVARAKTEAKRTEERKEENTTSCSVDAGCFCC